MDLKKMLGSKEYKEARAKIAQWHARLKKADGPELLSVRDEKSAFFASMMKENPKLYLAFQIDDKSLSEEIYKKLSGRDIILD